jgi:hypothetical protein
VVSPLLRGLLGIERDAFHKTIRFAPHLPADWQTVGVHRVPFLGARIDFDIHRDAGMLELKIDNSGSQSFDLDFAPAYAPCTHVIGATLDGNPVTWKEQPESSDWHPRFTVSVKPGASTLIIRHRGFFGYVVPFTPPRLAEPSANLKVISEHWTNNGQTVELTVSGRPGREYRIGLVGAKKGDSFVVRIPAGASNEYVQQLVTISP